MNTRIRKKITLLLFITLLVAGLCALAGYILAAHNLNMVVVAIDEMFVEAQDYVLLLYERLIGR